MSDFCKVFTKEQIDRLLKAGFTLKEIQESMKEVAENWDKLDD